MLAFPFIVQVGYIQVLFLSTILYFSNAKFKDFPLPNDVQIPISQTKPSCLIGFKNPKTIWVTKENKLWIENEEGTKLKQIENFTEIDSIKKYRIVLAIDQNLSNKYVLERIYELRDKGKNKFDLLVYCRI